MTQRNKAAATHKAMWIIGAILLLLILSLSSEQMAKAQVPVALAPSLHPQFLDGTGKPLSGGFLYFYASGTTTPQATFADNLGTIQNPNPVPLDATGATSNASTQVQVWLSNTSYKVCAYNSALVLQWCWDNVTGANGVLLSPAGGANQTISGPLTATQFNGPVSALLPSVTINTLSNPPTVNTTNPAALGQIYTIPDPLASANFVLSPGHPGQNSLDCTQAGITCYRTASFYFGGASCNGGTPSLGWDTFSTNNPLGFCLTGTNTVKGVMGLPSAYAHLQQSTGISSAAGTITTTYPNTLVGGNGDMLVLSVAFNATTTITGCTDGTNAYSQAKHVANGVLSLDVWVFHNATTKAAGTTLTCTFSAAASGALKWHEYLAPNATSTDVSASNTGTGTNVPTGTTASTAQATELIFAAAGDLAAPTLVNSLSGYADHGVLNNSTTVQVDDAGIIQQTISAQASAFTLGSSQAYAAAIVAFKATNGGPAVAQKTIVLPTFFNASQAMTSTVEWSNPLVAIGTSNVLFGISLSCAGQGTTDDPVFNAIGTQLSPAGQGAVNTTTQVFVSPISSTGCAAGNILHYQLSRLRYNVSDIYEGFANIYGDLLTLGINQ